MRKLKHEWICHGCAVKRGATWPKGVIVTARMDTCPYCKIRSGLTKVTDWKWTEKKA